MARRDRSPKPKLRPVDKEKVQYGLAEVEARADFDPAMSWNPIARLGFEGFNTDKSASGEFGDFSPAFFAPPYLTQKQVIEQAYGQGVPYNKALTIKPNDIFVDPDVGNRRVWSHEMTHRGFEKIIEGINNHPEGVQQGIRDFQDKYGKAAFNLLIAKGSKSHEGITEMFDDLADSIYRGEPEEQYLDDSNVEEIKSFQKTIKRKPEDRWQVNEDKYKAYIKLMDAAQDILTAQGEPPQSSTEETLLDKIKIRLGFAGGGMATDLEMDRAELLAQGIDPDYNDEVGVEEETSIMDMVKPAGKAGIAILHLIGKKLGLGFEPTKDNLYGFNEGGMAYGFGEQMDEIFAPQGSTTPKRPTGLAGRPGFRGDGPFDFKGFRSHLKENVSKEELQDGLKLAAEYLLPLYDSGVHLGKVLDEYQKPEGERNEELIRSELRKAGGDAVVDLIGGGLLAGIVSKFGRKAISNLAQDIATLSAAGAGAYLLQEKRDGYAGGGLLKAGAKLLIDEVTDAIETFSTPMIKEGVDAIEAAGLTDEAIETWRKENATSKEFRDALKGRNPDLQAQANRMGIAKQFEESHGKNIASGITNLTRDAYRKLADELRPIREVAGVPRPATHKEVVSALDKGKRKNPMIGLNASIPEGDKVEVRLNIPAYTDYDVWVPTIRHEGKEKYKPALRMQNVTFILPESSGPRKALRIAQGGEKNPFAVMTGQYVESSDQEAFDLAKNVFNSEEWTQVGYDPIKRGFFYDRTTGEAILSADEVVQVGHLVLAKNAKKASPDLYEFNEGGMATRDQMEMMFKSSRAGTDPVSGNDVPLGSKPEEVRDDIPAMLSEGEYVVPADVVRYFGVKFFEDLRAQAKMDLMSMERNGRMGGEPVEAPMPQGSDGPMSDEEFMLILAELDKQGQQPMQMNVGGYTTPGGYTATGYTPYSGITNSTFTDENEKFATTPSYPLVNPSQYLVPGSMTRGATGQPTAQPQPTTPTKPETTGETEETCAAKGMTFDPVTQTCVPMKNSGGEPKPIPTSDTRPWQEKVLKLEVQDPENPSNKITIDGWRDPLAYADKVLEPMNKGLLKGVGALAGTAGPLVAGFASLEQLEDISTLRAMEKLYRATGSTDLADQIKGKYETYLKDAKLTNLLDKVIPSDGDWKVNSYLRSIGFDIPRGTDPDEWLKTLNQKDRALLEQSFKKLDTALTTRQALKESGIGSFEDYSKKIQENYDTAVQDLGRDEVTMTDGKDSTFTVDQGEQTVMSGLGGADQTFTAAESRIKDELGNDLQARLKKDAEMYGTDGIPSTGSLVGEASKPVQEATSTRYSSADDDNDGTSLAEQLLKESQAFQDKTEAEKQEQYQSVGGGFADIMKGASTSNTSNNNDETDTKSGTDAGDGMVWKKNPGGYYTRTRAAKGGLMKKKK